jgi:hypothetical protein
MKILIIILSIFLSFQNSFAQENLKITFRVDNKIPIDMGITLKAGMAATPNGEANVIGMFAKCEAKWTLTTEKNKDLSQKEITLSVKKYSLREEQIRKVYEHGTNEANLINILFKEIENLAGLPTDSRLKNLFNLSHYSFDVLSSNGSLVKVSCESRSNRTIEELVEIINNNWVY